MLTNNLGKAWLSRNSADCTFRLDIFTLSFKQTSVFICSNIEMRHIGQGTTGGTLVNGVPVLALEQTGESSNESATNGDQEAEPQEDPIATTPPHFITVTGKA